MRLFGYYALHSFRNQLRKLFRTWVVAFILVCALLGGLIGFGAAKLSNAAEKKDAESAVEEVLPPEAEAAREEEHRSERRSTAELIAGAVIALLLVYNALSADKNGSRIFLPADVSLLFPSPLSPQSVLMFRLATQIGTAIAASIYLLFQLPSLIHLLGLTLWGSLAVIAAWGLTVIVGKLMLVLLYMQCSNHPSLRDRLRRIVYMLLALIAGAFLLFWQRSGASPLEAARLFFNAPASRYVPVWGWIKGFFLFAVEGNIGASLLCLGLTAAACLLLTAAIRSTRADFYEDAMAQSQETAELMEQAENGQLVLHRKTGRSDSLRRNEFHRGWGASVFFHKTIYNRFRFAHLHFFTKTMETYLAAGIGTAVLCRTVLAWEGGVTVALSLAALAFFRSLGNPLGEDTRMEYFRLIPESPGKKLFFSLLGGLVNTLLDLLPGLIVGTLIARGSLLAALGWLPFILSVDLYSTCVSTFIDLSVPQALGKMIKQFIQALFIYFGLLPDIALLALGFSFGKVIPAALAAAGINLLLGTLFFSLSPRFLDPFHTTAINAAGQTVDITLARRRFSRMGISSLLLLAAGSAIQIVASAWIRRLQPAWASAEWVKMAVTFLPMYLCAFPLGALVLRSLPASPPEKRAFSPSEAVSGILASFFMLYAGNLIGLGLNALISALTGANAMNPVEEFAYSNSIVWKVAFMVVIGPVWEEIFFRKILIDRMRPFGERLAIITSAVMFGLFHGNISQFFYAAGIGLVFGYLYLRTGKLWCTIGMHMLINLLGGVVSAALPETAQLIYAAAFVLLSISGAAVLLRARRRLRFEPAVSELPAEYRFSAAWLNPGMLFFALLCLGLIVLVAIPA